MSMSVKDIAARFLEEAECDKDLYKQAYDASDAETQKQSHDACHAETACAEDGGTGCTAAQICEAWGTHCGASSGSAQLSTVLPIAILALIYILN